MAKEKLVTHLFKDFQFGEVNAYFCVVREDTSLRATIESLNDLKMVFYWDYSDVR